MNIHPDETNTLDTFPRLYRFFDTDKQTQGREHSLDKKFTLLGNKLEQLMIAARQIFAVAVDSV